MNKMTIGLTKLGKGPEPWALDELNESDLEVCGYTIELDPDRAMENIHAALGIWMRERRVEPGAIVLGVETYWSLAYHESGGRFPLVEPTSWHGAPILIDDEIRWRVKLVASLDRAEHWRCAVETKS